MIKTFLNKISFFRKIRPAQRLLGALMVVVFFLVAFEANAGWKFWERKGICEKLVEPIVNKSLSSFISGVKDKEGISHKRKEMDHVQQECYKSILKTGDYKELYAYYLIYKYFDEALTKYRKRDQENIDPAPNNIYHYMLFYANQNSRDFDPKTNSFKNEQGLYEQELKDFEGNMTQEEKIKAFGYIADNLATGKEGWVKTNDYRKSFEYLKMAAEAGDIKSQAYLGYSYFTGLDWMKRIQVEKDYIQCYKWLYLSTLHSSQQSYVKKETLEALKTMTKNITPQQLHQAQQQAKIWLDQNKDFIKNHQLKIISMTEEEVAAEKVKTDKFIKEYGLDKPLSNNNTNQPNQ